MISGTKPYNRQGLSEYPRVIVQDCASHPADIDVEKGWDIQACAECDPSGVVTVRNSGVPATLQNVHGSVLFACSINTFFLNPGVGKG